MKRLNLGSRFSKIVFPLLILAVMASQGSNAVAGPCRDALRATDKVALEFRKAARAVNQDCKEDPVLCDVAILALDEALLVLGSSSDSLVSACQLVGTDPVQPQAGELVITEINVISPVVGAANQWFEVFNPTNKTIDLSGLSVRWISELAPNAGTIDPATIEPQAFKVIAFRPDVLETDFGIVGAVRLDAPLTGEDGSFQLGGFDVNSEIRIETPNLVEQIDFVSWLSSPFGGADGGANTSISRQLDPDAYDAGLNDFVNIPGESDACPTPDPFSGVCVWCSSTLTYDADMTQFGTPGAENTECPGVVPSQ